MSGIDLFDFDVRGTRSKAVQIGNLTVYFSYQTPIAYSDSDEGLVIRQNDWGPTTGHHLTSINPDKGIRVPGSVFEAKYKAMLKRHGLL